MGHTVSSQRRVIDRTLEELSQYAKALRPEDREILTKILKIPLKKVGAISYTSSLHAWALCILAISIEQEKRIIHLENVVNGRVPEGEQDHLMDKD